MMTHSEIKELLKNKEIEAWKKLKESRFYGNLSEAEKWIKAIEEASRMLLKNNYKELIEELEKVHCLMNKNPDNLYDINFNQCYYSLLNEAHNYLKKYINFFRK